MNSLVNCELTCTSCVPSCDTHSKSDISTIGTRTHDQPSWSTGPDDAIPSNVRQKALTQNPSFPPSIPSATVLLLKSMKGLKCKPFIYGKKRNVGIFLVAFSFFRKTGHLQIHKVLLIDQQDLTWVCKIPSKKQWKNTKWKRQWFFTNWYKASIASAHTSRVGFL